MVGMELAIGTVEARLHVQRKVSLSSTLASTIGASDLDRAGSVVCIELCQTREYMFASFAAEMSILQVLLEGIVVGCIEVTTGL